MIRDKRRGMNMDFYLHEQVSDGQSSILACLML